VIKMIVACCMHRAGGLWNCRESAGKRNCVALRKAYLMQNARTGSRTQDRQPLFSATYLQLCHKLGTSNLPLRFSLSLSLTTGIQELTLSLANHFLP